MLFDGVQIQYFGGEETLNRSMGFVTFSFGWTQRQAEKGALEIA